MRDACILCECIQGCMCEGVCERGCISERECEEGDAVRGYMRGVCVFVYVFV